MNKVIYGVDLSKIVTPVMVREAIIVCFMQAHKEILDLMDECTEWKSKEDRENFRSMKIKMIISNAFKEAGANFDNPTKEDLVNVINNLAKFASLFRKPEIIRKHYNEIMKLINKIA